MSSALLIYWHGVILFLLKVLLLSSLSFSGCSLPRLPLVDVDLANQLLTPLKIRNDCLCLGAGCCWLLGPLPTMILFLLPFPSLYSMPLSSQESHCFVLASLFCGQKHLPQSLMTHIDPENPCG